MGGEMGGGEVGEVGEGSGGGKREGRWEAAGGKGEENGGSGREGMRKWRLEEVRDDRGKRETERETRDVEGKERER